MSQGGGRGSEKCQKKCHVLFEWPLFTFVPQCEISTLASQVSRAEKTNNLTVLSTTPVLNDKLMRERRRTDISNSNYKEGIEGHDFVDRMISQFPNSFHSTKFQH